MSGHFLLLNIESGECGEALEHGAVWSGLVDDHAPWNNDNRAVLRAARRGERVVRRELPPHRYLECAAKHHEPRRVGRRL
jgi:hypothetical protein